jgi:predicted flap endonuclease-1-like 5' DNA nuclease
MEDTAWKDLMMATEKIRRLENSAPLAEGEFWRITGIGEATEQRLHAAGIDTFERLGSLSPEDYRLDSHRAGGREGYAPPARIGPARPAGSPMT